jgi:hypothetical protein
MTARPRIWPASLAPANQNSFDIVSTVDAIERAFPKPVGDFGGGSMLLAFGIAAA